MGGARPRGRVQSEPSPRYIGDIMSALFLIRGEGKFWDGAGEWAGPGCKGLLLSVCLRSSAFIRGQWKPRRVSAGRAQAGRTANALLFGTETEGLRGHEEGEDTEEALVQK